MTTFDLDSALSRRAGPWPRLAALFARWERARARRIARAHLLDQPDHILRDVGLTREEVLSWDRGDARFEAERGRNG